MTAPVPPPPAPVPAPPPTRARVGALLRAVSRVRCLVAGDLCLDAYAAVQPAGGERSLETGLAVIRAGAPRIGLGGAGNVAANAVALGAARVALVAVLGDDLFSAAARRLAAASHVRLRAVRQPRRYVLPTYGKPLLDGGEGARVDFGGDNRLQSASVREAVERIAAGSRRAGALVLNRQFDPPLLSDAALAWLATELAGDRRTRVPAAGALDARRRPGARRGPALVVDLRRYGPGGPVLHRALHKVSLPEACRLVGAAPPPPAADDTQALAVAATLGERWQVPLLVTRDQRGMVVWDGQHAVGVPGLVPAQVAVDPVGAGDTTAAAVALALAAGATLHEAAWLASLAAAVTVVKLRQTGTATPMEVLAACDRLLDAAAQGAARG